MPAQNTEWTADMVRALPDVGKRYEVLDGELHVSPSPNADHQRLVFALAQKLAAYARPNALGEVLFSPADLEYSPRRYVQPDVFVFPPTPVRVRDFGEIQRLILVAEVLSPSTARADRTRKRAIFQDERVPEYWIVDPDARLIERWGPDDERPSIHADTIRWQPDLAIAALELDLPAFFAEALD